VKEKYMEIILCDNCGGVGDRYKLGNLCEKCLPLFQAAMDELRYETSKKEEEIKRKYHIREK